MQESVSGREAALRSGIYLECPNKKKASDEEAPAPKKKAAKMTKAAAAALAATPAAIECSYSKRIGDAPPPPTAETHGPVAEKPEKKSGKKELQPA